jgi:cellulose biosynthesis protein BcsQ
MRHKAKRITIFNHKGGIGKTTLAVNIAAALADKGKRVLLIDSDPQCNLTSHLFNDEVVDDLLDASDSAKGKTLWSSLKPVVEATGPFKRMPPFETTINRMLLIPGDIKLSAFEMALNDFWTDCFNRRIRGLNGTNALSALVDETASQESVDFVFYDTGPNIGPLNRIILLDCDFFIVPAACDLFSVRALNTLGQTLSTWIRDWKMISALAPDQTYMMKGRPRFLGFIPQRFRIYGQVMAQTQSHYFAQLERRVFSDIISVLQKEDPAFATSKAAASKLGEVRDFGTIVQLAQQQGVPLDRVKGGNQELRAEAHSAFGAIAERILERAK